MGCKFAVLLFLGLSVVCFNSWWNLRRSNKNHEHHYHTNIIYSGHLTSRETKNVVKLYKSYYPTGCVNSVSPTYLPDYDLTIFTVSGTCHIDEDVFSSYSSRGENVPVQIPYAWSFDDAKHDLCVTPSGEARAWTVRQNFLYAKFLYPNLLSDEMVYETCDLRTVADANVDFSFEYSRDDDAGPLWLYFSHNRGMTWTDHDFSFYRRFRRVRSVPVEKHPR